MRQSLRPYNAFTVCKNAYRVAYSGAPNVGTMRNLEFANL